MRLGDVLVTLALPLSLGLAAGCGDDDETGDDDGPAPTVDAAAAVDAPVLAPDAGGQAVAIKFAGKVGADDAACNTDYANQGTSNATIQLKDFRFYVSNVRLIDDGDNEVPVALTQDGAFQVDDVALIDLEDATGGCGDSGTAQTNSMIAGTVAPGTYNGIKFIVGVPFDLNHDDVATAPSPLNIAAMYWAWAIGHKFVRIDLDVNAGGAWNMHLGSTMCQSDGMTDPPTIECARPNRAEVTLDAFDPATDTIVFDVAPLLADSDLTVNTDMTPPGCQSFPNDVNECTTLFPNLGLAFDTGACTNGCADQSVFAVQ